MTEVGVKDARSTSVDVTVNVMDTNDNEPRFTSNDYRVKLKEGNGKRDVVLVQATDADSGDFGKISYEIQVCPNTASIIIPIVCRPPKFQLIIEFQN